MAKTQITLTKHFPPDGKGPNAFLTEDNQRFKTFDAELATQLRGVLNIPISLEYHIEEKGQYVNNMIDGFEVIAGAAPIAAAAPAGDAVKGVDANSAIARANEAFISMGENPLDSPAAFAEAVDYFLDLQKQIVKTGAATPSSAGAVAESQVS